MAEVLQLFSTEPDPSDWLTFENFWACWPMGRRVAKKDAHVAWVRMTAAQRAAALTALVDWRQVWFAQGDLDRVVYPATWLNGERWEDDLPRWYVNACAARAQAKKDRTETPAAAGARIPPPPEFLALLEQLRAHKGGK